ncbi:hypothetical protein [Devosia sp.]|uniref:hypothetical protein n=1 Tax=Devosia sp. TaxID=1871048 RepID=UPI00326652C9
MLGLVTAGPSLQTAAVMLQEAAVGLGSGAAGAGGIGGKKPPGGRIGGIANTVSSLLGLGFLAQLAQDQGALKMPDPSKSWDRNLVDFLDPGLGRTIYGDGQPAAPHAQLSSPYDNLRAGGVQSTLNPDITTVDTSHMQQAGTEADATKAKLEALNTTLKPLVDMTNLRAFIALLQHALALQSKLAGPVGNGGSKTIGSLNSFSDGAFQP